MKFTRKFGIAAVMTVVAGTSMAAISVGPAYASGGPNPTCGGCGVTGGGGGGLPGGGGGGGGGGGLPGGGRASVLAVTDSCGGSLQFKETTAGTLSVSLTEFSVDPTVDSWSLQAVEQEYDATTGGRVGDPISLVPDTMGPLVFSAVDFGFTTSAEIPDTVNMTHGISYVATRTSPTPLTCAGQGFWTDHDGATVPDPLNPTAKPDTAPAPSGKNVAGSGTNVVTIGFDQEMLDSLQGIPVVNRFRVLVGGVAVPVTAVQVVDSVPPGSAGVTLTLGSVLQAGQTVSVQYVQPLLDTVPVLQDLGGLQTASFGVDIPVS